MLIENGNVVLVHYVLKDEKGTMMEASTDKEPLAFIFGSGMIIPGLEKALRGKGKGEKFSQEFLPEDAYGDFKEDLIQTISLSQFEDPSSVKEGAEFQLENQNGMALVTKVDGDNVTMDMNHPLAGQTLCFDIEVVDVRDATPEEIDHGHVHGVGGHHH